MIVFALKLILAHLLGDFVLQPDRWVRHKIRHKTRSPYLYFHLLVHASLLLLLLFPYPEHWLAIGIIITTHYLIDLLKLYLVPVVGATKLFILDQLCHLGVLVYVVLLYFPINVDWSMFYSPGFLLLLTTLLLVTQVAAILMRLLMSNWSLEEIKESEALPNAGKVIGILERLFIFGFVIFGYWQGIGFLIAAKSILRFSDLSRTKDRKLTEYVLIGTLLSFAMAILTGLLYLFLSDLPAFK